MSCSWKKKASSHQRAPGFPHRTGQNMPKLQSKGNVEPLGLAGVGTPDKWRNMEEHYTIYTCQQALLFKTAPTCQTHFKIISKSLVQHRSSWRVAPANRLALHPHHMLGLPLHFHAIWESGWTQRCASPHEDQPGFAWDETRPQWKTLPVGYSRANCETTSPDPKRKRLMLNHYLNFNSPILNPQISTSNHLKSTFNNYCITVAWNAHSRAFFSSSGKDELFEQNGDNRSKN